MTPPTPPPSRLPTRPPTCGGGRLAGLVSGAGGLAVAEVVAAASPRLRSPVLDVGDRAIDAVPAPVKRLAIEWFGTNDKLALLVGILAVVALYAVGVGLAWFRHRRALALAGVALFGVLGTAAALGARLDRPWWAATPSVVGAIATAAALMALSRLVATDPDDPAAPDLADPAPAEIVRVNSAQRELPAPERLEREPAAGRRRFLLGLGAVAVGAAGLGWAGRQLQGRFSAVASRAAVRLPGPAVPAPPVPAGVTSGVAGVTPFVTPNAEFYRIDTALTVPQVPVEGWRLAVTGLVDRPLSLDYQELLARPLTEVDVTLVCVSNVVGGNLAGNARWLGVRLDDLLAEAGVDPGADQIVGRSVDGYTCGFPLAALDGRPALVAVGMNGEPLPLVHGFPARLLVPGLYGYVSATKWLTEIELTRFDAFDQYWVPRGWDAEAPIKLQSRIDTPRGLATVAAGPVPVGGVAWAPGTGIGAVEVRVDDGPWWPPPWPPRRPTSPGASGPTCGRRNRAATRSRCGPPTPTGQSRPTPAPNPCRAVPPANTRSW